MVQPAEDRRGVHCASGRASGVRRIGDPLLQALVRSGRVVVRYVLPEDMAYVGFVEDE
jgi:hypothetical protein